MGGMRASGRGKKGPQRQKRLCYSKSVCEILRRRNPVKQLIGERKPVGFDPTSMAGRRGVWDRTEGDTGAHT